MKQERWRGGLSAQAWLGKQQGRQEARRKAPFTLRCPPPLLLYTSDQPHVPFCETITYTIRLILLIMSFFASITDFVCLHPVEAHVTLSKMPDVKKNLPRSVFVCLPPSPPSVPLPPSSLCIFHLLVVTLSNDSIYFRKQCPIYLELGGGTSAVVIFFLLWLVILKGGRETTIWQHFELFAVLSLKLLKTHFSFFFFHFCSFFFFLNLILNSPSTLIWFSLMDYAFANNIDVMGNI